MHHLMSLSDGPFERIKSGKETIEVRLFDKKRKGIRLGDTITFVRRSRRDESIVVEVIGLSRFRSFRDLFSTFDKSKFGYPDSFTLDDQIKSMRKFYSKKREKKLGVLALHIRLIDQQ